MTNINYEVANQVATITLNRPEKMNALFGMMREDLLKALKEAESNTEVRVIVITGAGTAFCAGGDINYMVELREKGDKNGFKRLLDAGRNVVTKIRSIPKPVLAKINGTAVGAGLNLALACDIRIASNTATFGEAFSKVGLCSDWGGMYFLTSLVGTATAAELFFAGDIIDAKRAEKIGLVNKVVSKGELDAVVAELTRKFVKASPATIKLAKIGICKALNSNLQDILDYEVEAQLACFDSDDFKDRVTSFVKKEGAFVGR